MVKNLKSKNCFYVKADKGNTVVILDKNDYHSRVSELINTGPYVKIPKSPINQMVNLTKQTLKNCPNILDQKTRFSLVISNPIVPRLYCLPKIHKPGKSVRPIVSAIDSPTYKISQWLVQKFEDLKFPSASIANTHDLLEKLKNIKLKPSEMLISFDVTSLFPSIPIPETIEILKNTLLLNNMPNAEEYISLTKLCMEQNYFVYNGDYYKQCQGTAMGNSLSPFLANLFMSHFETTARNSFPYFPKIWHRYVDDVITIFDTDKCSLDDFIRQLNNLYPSIKFTFETETDGKLPFLDLLIIKNNNAELEFDIYRKPTANHRFILNSSNHSLQSKLSCFNSMIHRLLSIPLSPDRYTAELNFIKEIAVYNEFDPSIIDRILRKQETRKQITNLTTLTPITKDKHSYIKLPHYPHITKGLQPIFHTVNKKVAFSNKNTISSLLGSPKDPVPPTQKSGIYQLPCENCPLSYIGQTRRSIAVRAKEHIAHFKNNRRGRSAVADHIFDTGHFFDPSKISLLKSCSWPYLDSYESISIQKNKNNLINSDLGPIPSSSLFQLLK